MLRRCAPLIALLLAACGALSPPGRDAGADAGPDASIDAGAMDAGGTDAGADDAGLGDGGLDGPPALRFPLVALDGGVWMRTSIAPSRNPQPPVYGGLAGRVVDGGWVLWTGDGFGDLWHFDGASWAQAHDGTGFVQPLAASADVVVGGASDRVYGCLGACGQPTPHVPGFSFSPQGACASDGVGYVVGKNVGDGTAALLRFDGAWTELPTTLANSAFSGCVILPDGALLLVGERLWRREPGGTIQEEPVVGSLSPAQRWRGVVAAAGGEVLAFGTGFRVAQRLDGRSWRVVQALDASDPTPFRAATPLANGDVLFAGFTDDASTTSGTVELLLLSFARSQWLRTSTVTDVSVYAVLGASEDDLVLAGAHRQVLGNTVGGVMRWRR